MEKEGRYALIIFIFLCVLVGPLMSAQTTEPRFFGKPNQTLDIFEECDDKGVPCDTGFKCNITIKDPNLNVLVLNQAMTRNDTSYNFTVPKTATPFIGSYENTVNCNNVTVGGFSTFFYTINPSGKDFQTSDSLIYIISISVSIFIFLLFLIGGFKTPWKHPRNNDGKLIGVNNFKNLKVALFVVSYLIFIWIINLLVAVSNNFLFLGIAFNFFKIMYFILLALLWPGLLMTVFFLFVNYVNSKRIQEALNRGIFPNG